MATVRMFVNGQAMSGGSLHYALSGARFLGAVATASRYRFYAFPGDFPGLRPVSDAGVSVPGELYEVSYSDLRDRLLPGEPAELELSAIELSDGAGSLSMVARQGSWEGDGVVDISEFGGWRAYLASVAAHGR